MFDTYIRKTFTTFIVSMFLFNVCMAGNKQSDSNVSVLDSIESIRTDFKKLDSVLKQDVKLLQDSLHKLYNQLEGYDEFKLKSESTDKAVWIYGSSIIGVMVGIIILFGIIYFFAATTAARGVFENNFGTYTDRLNQMLKEARLTKNRLVTEFKLQEDTFDDRDDFESTLNEEYNDDDTTES